MTEEQKEVEVKLEDRVAALEYFMQVYHEELREKGTFVLFMEEVQRQNVQNQLNLAKELLNNYGFDIVEKPKEELDTGDTPKNESNDEQSDK